MVKTAWYTTYILLFILSPVLSYLVYLCKGNGYYLYLQYLGEVSHPGLILGYYGS